MDLFNVNIASIFSFFLILFRTSVLMFLMPFFGGSSLPVMAKASLCLVLSLALWPHFDLSAVPFPAHPFGLLLMFLGEVVLGLAMGLVMKMVFAGIQVGGQFVGTQMGLAMVNIMDPDTGSSEAVTAHLLYMVSMLVFLVFDGHLVLLKAMTNSFSLLPPGSLFISPLMMEQVMSFSKVMFTLAVKVAAPIMAVLFLVELALALVARAAPQMNVLLIGFPLKISVGMFFLSVLFSILSLYIGTTVQELGPILNRIIEAGNVANQAVQ